MIPDTLPRICIITTFAMDTSHGTGALLLRQLSEYPKERILNVCLHKNQGCSNQKSLEWLGGWESQDLLWWYIRHGQFSKYRQGIKQKHANKPIMEKIRAFDPQLLMVIAVEHVGICAAAEIAREYPHVPIYCCFWDLFMGEAADEAERDKQMRYLLNNARRVDCISEPMAEFINTTYGVPVHVRNFFCCDLPATFKCVARKVDDGLKPAMVGNIWVPSSMIDLLWMLAAAKVRYPSMQDTTWYCRPDSLVRFGWDVSTLPPGIRYGGWEDSDVLIHKLADHDFCIMPISGAKAPWEQWIARYSIPSKVSEVFSAGIPIFALAEESTAVSRYLKYMGGGQSTCPVDRAGAIREFHSFLHNHKQRERMGLVARKFAESEYDARQFRPHFYQYLSNLSQCRMLNNEKAE